MIESILRIEEGYREKAYYCSNGYPTIGIGTKIGPKGADLSNYTFKVSKYTAYEMLNDELVSVKTSIIKDEEIGTMFSSLDPVRQAVVLSMCYQMGFEGFLGFRNTIKAIKAGDWDESAKEMRDSKWAKHDSPERARRHAEMMRTGVLLDYYKK